MQLCPRLRVPILYLFKLLQKSHDNKCRFGVGHLLCRANTWSAAKGNVLPRWPSCLPSLRTEEVSVIFAPNFGINVHGLCVNLNACPFSDQYWRFSVIAATDGQNCVLVADSKDAIYVSMEADSCLVSSERRITREVFRYVLSLNM